MTKLSTRLFAEFERRPEGVQYYSSSVVDSGDEGRDGGYGRTRK